MAGKNGQTDFTFQQKGVVGWDLEVRVLFGEETALNFEIQQNN